MCGGSCSKPVPSPAQRAISMPACMRRRTCRRSWRILRRARRSLSNGSSVILDGTWRDARQRERARSLGEQVATPIVEFSCSVPLKEASRRIQERSGTNSEATPHIAAALAKGSGKSRMHTLSIPADR